MDIPTTWEDCPVYTTVPWAEGKRCQESDPIYVFVMCTWLWICRTTFPLNSQSSFLSIPLVFHSVLRLRSRSIIFMKSLTRHQGHRSWDLSISDKYIHQRIYCITGDQGYIRHWGMSTKTDCILVSHHHVKGTCARVVSGGGSLDDEEGGGTLRFKCFFTTSLIRLM